MSTVYITQQLTKDIHRVISRMKDNEVMETVPKVGESLPINAAELLNRLAWGDHYHLMAQMPKEWLRQPSSVDINVITSFNENGTAEEKQSVCFNKVDGHFERPCNDRWGAPRSECTKEWLEQHLHFTGAQEALAKVADGETRDEIKAKWDKTFADISKFLSKCKSLNEGLKLWPTLQLYIPAEYMERVNTKIVRKVREAELLSEVDVDELTAAAIAAKLSGVVA